MSDENTTPEESGIPDVPTDSSTTEAKSRRWFSASWVPLVVGALIAMCAFGLGYRVGDRHDRHHRGHGHGGWHSEMDRRGADMPGHKSDGDNRGQSNDGRGTEPRDLPGMNGLPDLNDLPNPGDLPGLREPNQESGPRPSTDRAYLGVRLSSSSADTNGATIGAVVSGSPADTAGLKVGDVITKLGDATIGSPSDLVAAVADHAPKDSVKVTFTRDGAEQTLDVTLSSPTVAAASSAAVPA